MAHTISAVTIARAGGSQRDDGREIRSTGVASGSAKERPIRRRSRDSFPRRIDQLVPEVVAIDELHADLPLPFGVNSRIDHPGRRAATLILARQDNHSTLFNWMPAYETGPVAAQCRGPCIFFPSPAWILAAQPDGHGSSRTGASSERPAGGRYPRENILKVPFHLLTREAWIVGKVLGLARPFGQEFLESAGARCVRLLQQTFVPRLQVLERIRKEMIQAKEARIDFRGDNILARFNAA